MLEDFTENEIYLNRCITAVGQSKDESYFSKLFDYYAGRVKSYVLSKGVTDATAEKLAQKTMLLMLRMSPAFDPTKATASTWVFSIARDTWLEHYRGQSHIKVSLVAETPVTTPPHSMDSNAIVNNDQSMANNSRN